MSTFFAVRYMGLEHPLNPESTKKRYHELARQYHPDKFEGKAHCAQAMSLIVNAGKELIEGFTTCGYESHSGTNVSPHTTTFPSNSR